jgi:hypothetical protein
MFKFPAEKLANNSTWFEELQHPLDFTVAEINTDLTKFVKDFPTDIIPHQTDSEYKLGTRHILSNIKQVSEARVGLRSLSKVETAANSLLQKSTDGSHSAAKHSLHYSR